MTLLPIWLAAIPIMQAMPVLCMAMAVALIPAIGRPYGND